MKNNPYICSVKLLKQEIMEQNHNEMVPFVTDYVPYLDDDETEDGEVKIGFSKEPFDLSKVLCSTKYD